MTGDHDPSTTTARERVAAISEILAIGYLRSLACRKSAEKPLGTAGEPEASCARMVGRNRNSATKEVS